MPMLGVTHDPSIHVHTMYFPEASPNKAYIHVPTCISHHIFHVAGQLFTVKYEEKLSYTCTI